MDPILVRVLTACGLAWLVSQCLKFAINAYHHRDGDLQTLLFAQGGMPSSHAAFVTALALGLLIEEGLSSASLIACAYGIITIRDAVGVRLEVGRHATRINAWSRNAQLVPTGNEPMFEEHVGHTAYEAAAGVVVAIVCVLLVVL